MYEKIRISFIDAGEIVIEAPDWDDYDFVDGFIVIKKRRSMGCYVQCE